MNTHCIFLADVHLDDTFGERHRLLIACLEKAQSTHADVYILGDLFESWIGDDGATEADIQIIQAIKKLTQSGVNCFIQHGNRDFMLGQAFLDQTGAHLIPDPHIITLNHETILLSHGDQYCTDDVEYQEIRRKLRDPNWQKQALSQPVEVRRAIAKQARAASADYQKNVTETLLDVNSNSLKQAADTHQAKIFIHGHTHRPHVHHTSQAHQFTRYVLGDWHPDGEILWHHDQAFFFLSCSEYLEK